MSAVQVRLCPFKNAVFAPAGWLGGRTVAGNYPTRAARSLWMICSVVNRFPGIGLTSSIRLFVVPKYHLDRSQGVRSEWVRAGITIRIVTFPVGLNSQTYGRIGK